MGKRHRDSTGARIGSMEEFRARDFEYIKAILEELGPERLLEIDTLSEMAESGWADVAAPKLEQLPIDFKLPEGSLARSRIEHQAGVAYRFALGGDHNEALRRARELLERAYRCRARKRHHRAWAETALHLSHCYRDLARGLPPEARERALSKSERLLHEGIASLEKLGWPGAFHRASAIASLANLAMERGDAKRRRRINRAALELIEERVALLGWNDPTIANPQRLYATIASNSVIALLEERSAEALEVAADDLEAALRRVDQPILRFQLAQVRSMQGAIDQRNLDALATPETVLSLPEQALDAVAVLLAEGEATEAVEAFFFDVIEHLVEVRKRQHAHHAADHTAQRMQHFARHWAKLIAKNDPTRAFCVVEMNKALRMQEAVRFHQWLPKDEQQATAYEEWTKRGELAATFAGWAALVKQYPQEARSTFMKLIEARLDPMNPDGADGFDELNAEGIDRLWQEYQRLDRSLAPEVALSRHAELLDGEASEIRRELEQDARFVQAHRGIPPIDADRLRDLLAEMKGTAFVRLEYLDDEALVFYADLDRDGEPRIRVDCVPFPGEALEIDARHMWETGRIPDQALAALSEIDWLAHVPMDKPRRVLLLQSGPLSLLPTLVIGPPGKTVLDRFDAIQTLWNLAPLRVRPAEAERTGVVTLYPGRDIPFAEKGSTIFHGLASSIPLGSDAIDMGRDASIREVTRAWETANIVCFYGHGQHFLMDGESPVVGPQLLLGTGEPLGMGSLHRKTFGMERAELWACRSGTDFPCDPMFPVTEGFGFDYELIRSGVSSTIGTLWSVDELVTSFIVLRFRSGLREGHDAARSLADAQRWWRDVARPSIIGSSDVIETVCVLWRETLGHDPGDAELPIRAWLARKQQNQDAWRVFLESVTSPIAHAAYRFCGMLHRPNGPLRPPRTDVVPDQSTETRRVSQKELEHFPIIRQDVSATTEIDAFYNEAADLLGFVIRDDYDEDFGFIVLGRESREAPFRFIDGDGSFSNPALAESALLEAMHGPGRTTRQENAAG